MDATIDTNTNLIKVLRAKGISTSAVRAVIGVKQDKSVREKLAKIRPFNLSEAKRLHKDLLSEYDFEYLFNEYADVGMDEE